MIPACPVGQHVNYDDASGPACRTSTPLPTGDGGVGHRCRLPDRRSTWSIPDPANNEDLFTFTEPSQMQHLRRVHPPRGHRVDDRASTAAASTCPPSGRDRRPPRWRPTHCLYVPHRRQRGTPDGQGCVGRRSRGRANSLPLRRLGSWPTARSDGNIYLGEQSLCYSYTHFGDADACGTIAHEWGHRIQQVAGSRLGERRTTHRSPLRTRLTASPVSFLDYSARHTALGTPSTRRRHLRPVHRVVQHRRGTDGRRRRSHGTIDQRIRAFYIGYNSPDSQGAWACDFYITNGSIIPSSRMSDGATEEAPIPTVAP